MEPQPFAGRKLDLQIYFFVRLHVGVGVYEATSEADVIDSSFVSVRHALPLRFEQNSLSPAASSLFAHRPILNDEAYSRGKRLELAC